MPGKSMWTCACSAENHEVRTTCRICDSPRTLGEKPEPTKEQWEAWEKAGKYDPQILHELRYLDNGAEPIAWRADLNGETANIVAADGGRLFMAMNLKGPYGLRGRRDGVRVSNSVRLVCAMRNQLPAVLNAIERLENQNATMLACAESMRLVHDRETEALRQQINALKEENERLRHEVNQDWCCCVCGCWFGPEVENLGIECDMCRECANLQSDIDAPRI